MSNPGTINIEAPTLGSMDYWRDQVAKWAAIHPDSKRAREAKEPEKAARILHRLSTGEPITRVSRTEGITKIEASRIRFHHAGAMAECLAGNAGQNRNY